MTFSISPNTQQNDKFPVIQQQIPVTFNYSVHFTKDIFNRKNPLLAQTIAADGTEKVKKAIAVVDAGLLCHRPLLLKQIKQYADWYDKDFCLTLDPITVIGGEQAKNDAKLVQTLHAWIERAQLCRHSYILAIGGGAILDMVGYAAATAHRGIRLIRIPTTVLSQNDSGVGVKNGINAFHKKNFLGTFAPPYAVINDCHFLTTLDDRDWRSGMAEAIKVALIKDATFFDEITTHAEQLVNRNLAIMQQIIYRCAQLHLAHIANSGDPFEMGSSRPLDFGHWAAHKLEYLTDYQLRHGEAVAIGIALDCTYSYLVGLLSWKKCQRIINTLKCLGFDVSLPQSALHKETNSSLCLFQGLKEFQEHLGGELTIMLLQDIGQGIEVHEVDISLYQRAVSLLQNWDN